MEKNCCWGKISHVMWTFHQRLCLNYKWQRTLLSKHLLITKSWCVNVSMTFENQDLQVNESWYFCPKEQNIWAKDNEMKVQDEGGSIRLGSSIRANPQPTDQPRSKACTWLFLYFCNLFFCICIIGLCLLNWCMYLGSTITTPSHWCFHVSYHCVVFVGFHPILGSEVSVRTSQTSERYSRHCLLKKFMLKSIAEPPKAV